MPEDSQTKSESPAMVEDLMYLSLLSSSSGPEPSKDLERERFEIAITQYFSDVREASLIGAPIGMLKFYLRARTIPLLLLRNGNRCKVMVPWNQTVKYLRDEFGGTHTIPDNKDLKFKNGTGNASGLVANDDTLLYDLEPQITITVPKPGRRLLDASEVSWLVGYFLLAVLLLLVFYFVVRRLELISSSQTSDMARRPSQEE